MARAERKKTLEGRTSRFESGDSRTVESLSIRGEAVDAGVNATDSTSETSGFDVHRSATPEAIVVVVKVVVRVADGDRERSGDEDLPIARGDSVSESSESTSAASPSWPDSCPVSTKRASARTRPVRLVALVARIALRAVVSVGWNGSEYFVAGGRVR